MFVFSYTGLGFGLGLAVGGLGLGLYCCSVAGLVTSLIYIIEED